MYFTNQYKNLQPEGCRAETRVTTIIAAKCYDLLIEVGNYFVYSDVNILVCILGYCFILIHSNMSISEVEALKITIVLKRKMLQY